MLLALLPAAGCQDGYPIAATRCDRWCEITQRQCGDEAEPAQCVEACEQQPSWLMAECGTEYEALLACLDAHRSKMYCGMVFQGFEPACAELQTKYSECVMQHAPQPVSGDT